MNEDPREDLFGDLERRALYDLPEDDDDAADGGIDLVDALRDRPTTEPPQDGGVAGGEEAAHIIDPAAPDAADMTLGGYIDLHNRVPAFEGSDGMPYTVDIDVEAPAEADRPWAAFLVFIRWAATGAGIMDHVESGDIAFGEDEESARQAAYELSLYEVRTELDAAIARRAHREPQE